MTEKLCLDDERKSKSMCLVKGEKRDRELCFFVGCLTSQQQASVSQGRICSHNFTCCHTEIEVADPTSTSPSHSILTPGRPVPVLTLQRQGSHWSANFQVTGMTRPRKKSRRKRDSNPGPSALEADALPLGQRGGRQGEERKLD